VAINQIEEAASEAAGVKPVTAHRLHDSLEGWIVRQDGGHLQRRHHVLAGDFLRAHHSPALGVHDFLVPVLDLVAQLGEMLIEGGAGGPGAFAVQRYLIAMRVDESVRPKLVELSRVHAKAPLKFLNVTRSWPSPCLVAFFVFSPDRL
jgi:hypothetical protein